MKLGQILVRKKIISSQQLQQALQVQSSKSQKIGEILIGKGFIQPQQLQEAMLEQQWREKGFWVID